MTPWHLLLLFAAFYIVNMALSLRQMHNFSRTFSRLRSQGRVVIGKHQSLFSWGAIVMFRLDENDAIREGTRLSGVTVFSRFRALTTFDGTRAGELGSTLAGQPRLPRAVRLAVANADRNYALHTAGQTPQDPPGPFARILNKMSRTKTDRARKEH
ncbi:transcriptional regulator GutM [Microbacterium sp.]|uniref:transcriptional regulator GutM n=1 Tax=Microbacterium sp. TaxID=51671 RepID=UPI003C75F9E8